MTWDTTVGIVSAPAVLTPAGNTSLNGGEPGPDGVLFRNYDATYDLLVFVGQGQNTTPGDIAALYTDVVEKGTAKWIRCGHICNVWIQANGGGAATIRVTRQAMNVSGVSA